MLRHSASLIGETGEKTVEKVTSARRELTEGSTTFPFLTSSSSSECPFQGQGQELVGE